MSNSSKNEDWTDCPSGELRSLGERLRIDHLRGKQRAAYRTVAISALALLLLFGVTQWLGPEDNLGGITCGECFAHFDAYNAHLTGGVTVDEPLASQLQEHLANCKVCRPKFEARFPDVLTNSIRVSGRVLARRDVRVAMTLL